MRPACDLSEICNGSKRFSLGGHLTQEQATLQSTVSLATRRTMSATSAARAYRRDITGETLALMRASDKPLTADAIERSYPPLRPTVYRPSRPTGTRAPARDETEVKVLRIKQA